MTTAENYTHPELERLMADPQYHTLPPYRIQVETMRRMMFAFTNAMREEGWDGAFVERVLSRTLYGEPNGAKVRREADEQIKKAKGDG